MTERYKLKQRLEKIFSEMVEIVARWNGANLADIRVRKRIETEVEEMTEQWDEDDHDSFDTGAKPGVTQDNEMRKLLLEHHEICEAILDIQDDLIAKRSRK